MAKPLSLSRSLKGSTDPDMEVAQYLVQLSGEDIIINEQNESSNSNNHESKSKNESHEEKEQKQIYVSSTSSNNTEEIVDRETMVFQLKKRRYRSIASIYGSTKPLEVILQASKKIRSNEMLISA